MCVIATGLKKKFKREWFIACCDHNPDGFFVSRVNKNKFIRTLSKKEALSFFDKSKDTDEIVLHARIKSVGDVTEENIHGWEDNGLQFCHNGTLRITADEGKTDSETFFRNLLLPIYKSQWYRMNDVVTRGINTCIGTSKFLVIRKKKVHLFGDYMEKNGCKFSNLFWDYGCFRPTSYSPASYRAAPYRSSTYSPSLSPYRIAPSVSAEMALIGASLPVHDETDTEVFYALMLGSCPYLDKHT